MKERSVVAIIRNIEGEILLGKKRQDSKKFLSGEWHVPGEGVEEGESDEEALIRGMLQETNLEIRVGKYLASHITPTRKKEAKWYECFALSDNLIPGSDLEDAKFVNKEEVLKVCSERAYTLWPKEIIDYFSE